MDKVLGGFCVTKKERKRGQDGDGEESGGEEKQAASCTGKKSKVHYTCKHCGNSIGDKRSNLQAHELNCLGKLQDFFTYSPVFWYQLVSQRVFRWYFRAEIFDGITAVFRGNFIGYFSIEPGSIMGTVLENQLKMNISDACKTCLDCGKYCYT